MQIEREDFITFILLTGDEGLTERGRTDAFPFRWLKGHMRNEKR